MGLRLTRSGRENVARQDRQIPLVEADLDDIRSISGVALKAEAPSFAQELGVTAHHGGVIVRFNPAPLSGRAARHGIRDALENLGYVLADGDAGSGMIIVTGRDPQHPRRGQAVSGGA